MHFYPGVFLVIETSRSLGLLSLIQEGKNESHAESMIESLFIFIYRHMTRAAGIRFCKCLAKQESQSLSVFHSVCFDDSSIKQTECEV